MKMLKITLQGKTYEVGVEVIDGAAPVAPAPVAGGHSVTSPMPGLVFKIGVAIGQQVARDQELLVLEAMKMESPVYAPCAGTVASILVKEGDAVSEGQVLIQLS